MQILCNVQKHILTIEQEQFRYAKTSGPPSSASRNVQKIGGNLQILVSKFDFTNLRKYLTPESAGGRILTFCMSVANILLQQ